MNAVPNQAPTTQADYYTDLPVGEILRRTRVHYGQSLDDVANYLRIRASQLEAIEGSNLEHLPGRVYAIGYIRTYAEYLGLDGEKMVHLFKQQSEGRTARPELHFPVPASESKVPNLYVIFGSLAVLGLVIGVWITLGAVGRMRDDSAAAVPSVPAELRVEAKEQVKPQSATPAAALPPAPVAVANIPSEPAGAPTVPQTHNAAATMPAQTAGQITGQAPQTAGQAAPAPAAVPAKKQIIITVKDSSWVEVRNKNGKVILSRILKPGEVFIVPESNYGLRLDTGNAGGIELTVNGLPVPPLGKPGDILRGYVLDGNAILKKMHAVSAVTPTPVTSAEGMRTP